MGRPSDDLCNEGVNRSRSRPQFGAPHPPSPAPGRRALQIPDGSWIDGLEPGFVTRHTQARRIAVARSHPDSPAFDTIRPGALRRSADSGHHVQAQRQVTIQAGAHNRRRDDLARQLGGIIEVHMRPGRADVATPRIVFEVEPRRTLEKGAQEAVAYAARCGLQPALAVFGVIPREELSDIYMMLRERRYFGLRAAAHLQLWWWTGTEWNHISTRSRCVNMPRGSTFGPCRHCGRQIVWLAGHSPGRICHNYDPEANYDTWADRHEHHCKGLCKTRHVQGPACQIGQVTGSLP